MCDSRNLRPSFKMKHNCIRLCSEPTWKQLQLPSSRQHSNSMSYSTALKPTARLSVLISHCHLAVLTNTYVCWRRLSDKLEIQTQKSHRISKDFEGAVTLQDAGMQTLEVNLCLGHALAHFTSFKMSTQPTSRTYLAHHELESVVISIIIIIIVIIIIIITQPMPGHARPPSCCWIVQL